MPHDPVRVADARGWVDKAKLDLAAGEAEEVYESIRSRLPPEVRP